MSDEAVRRPDRSSRVLYVQCSAGVAGDMLLGALVDAGADPTAVMAALGGLDLDGYAVTFERVQRAGVAATWANVVVDGSDHDGHDHGHDGHDHGHGHGAHDGHHPHRPASAIRHLLERSDLGAAVRATAQRIFDTLAEAEAAVHGIGPDDVEFHEVGSVDAIVDVVGIAAALESLGVERIVAGPIAMGRGTVHAAHGDLPNPPPAVARMLATHRIPVIGIDTGMELATPTGVAVLAALADGFGALPPMTVDAAGYGAGTADPPGRPNVVQVLVGTPATPSRTPAPGQEAVTLEVNVDDVTGEVLAHTIGRLLAAGAFDAWATPIVMKKGRPAHTVAALCDPALVEAVAAVLLDETGSLGIRATAVARWPQRRQAAVVDVGGQAISVKVAAGRVKVEHDDAAAAAAALGRPLRDVIAAAERAAADRGRSEG